MCGISERSFHFILQLLLCDEYMHTLTESKIIFTFFANILKYGQMRYYCNDRPICVCSLTKRRLRAH